MKQFLAVACLLLVSQTEARFSNNLMVKLGHGGGVYGKYMTSHSGLNIGAFTGIPYAEAPVGNLRFMDTVQHNGWTGFLDNNYNFGNQLVGDYNVNYKGIDNMCVHMNGNNQILGQEDCLYLNVYVPLVRRQF